jgi:hypothetical protein
MFVEALEKRCLLSATVGVEHERFRQSTYTLEKIIGVLENVQKNGQWDGKISVKSKNFLMKLKFIYDFYKSLTSSESRNLADSGLTTSDLSFSFSIAPDPNADFPLETGLVFGSLPTTYNFTLNPKNPFSLFTIKESSGGTNLLLTAKMTKNFKEITGVLHVTGPGQHFVYPYTAVAAT